MNDYMIRATAAEGQIRAFAATTRDMVEKAKNAHNTSPVATAALGRLMTAAAMMGADLKGEKELLRLRIEGSGPLGGLLVTANGHGDVKGYAFNPDVMLPPNAQGKARCRRFPGPWRFECYQGHWFKMSRMWDRHSSSQVRSRKI